MDVLKEIDLGFHRAGVLVIAIGTAQDKHRKGNNVIYPVWCPSPTHKHNINVNISKDGAAWFLPQ